MVTQHDVERFERDGYLILRGVFGGEELQRLRELARGVQRKVRDAVQAGSPLPGTRSWFGRGRQKAEGGDDPATRAAATWGINELPRPELFEPELVDVLGHPHLDAATQAILGPEPAAWGIKLLWSPTTCDYDLGWHRDQMKPALYDYAHTKPARNDHVQYNAALNDDACFLVVPGSHRRPLNEAEWHAVREDRTAELPGQVVAELGPGDVVFMDAHALHRGRCSAAGDRLTLHYSARAAWLPVTPWGHEGHFDWITSDRFIDQLSPATRPYYRALRERERSDDPMRFLKESAAAAGWVAA